MPIAHPSWQRAVPRGVLQNELFSWERLLHLLKDICTRLHEFRFHTLFFFWNCTCAKKIQKSLEQAWLGYGIASWNSQDTLFLLSLLLRRWNQRGKKCDGSLKGWHYRPEITQQQVGREAGFQEPLFLIEPLVLCPSKTLWISFHHTLPTPDTVPGDHTTLLTTQQ